jgi:hypothetical protein
MRRLAFALLAVTGACGSHGAGPDVVVAAFALSQPVNAVAGVPVTFRVTALDSSGAVVKGYRGTVQFASDDAHGTTPSDITFTAADAGLVNARAVFKTAGERSFVVVDRSNPNLFGIVHLVVLPAAAAQLALSGPSAVTAGTPISLQVTAFDPYQNQATGFGGTVHFSSTDAAAQLPADTALAPGDAGARPFQVTLLRATTTAITVSAEGVAAATVTISVTPGAAANVALIGLPAQTPVDTSQSVTVAVHDAFGNVVADYAGTLHFSNTDLQASPLADLPFTAADKGVKTVSLQFGTAGAQTLGAADIATPTIAGSASTQVLPGAPANLGLGGVPPSTIAGTALSVVVTVIDRHGNDVTGFTGAVHLASTDPAAALPTDYTFTAADGGRHTFAVVFATAANTTLSVSSQGLPAANATVAVAHAAAGQVTLEGLPAQVAVDSGQTLTVRVRDAFGNLVTEYAGTLRFTSTDAAAPAIPDATFVATDLGSRTISASFRTAGPQTITAADTVKPTLRGAASTFVLHGPAIGLALVGIPSATVAGTPLTAVVSAVDGQGNVATDFNGTLHFSSTDPGAALPADYTFTAADLGTHSFQLELTRAAATTLTVTSAGLPPVSATVAVAHAPASLVTLEALPPQIAVDVPAMLTVTVRDAFANVVVDYAGTLTFVITDPQAPAIANATFGPADQGIKSIPVRFATAGTQTVTASDTLTPTLRGSATTLVLHGPAVALTLSGLPPSITAGSLLAATVTAVDLHGNVATDFAGTVHFSSTDPTAQLPADFAFTSTDRGVRTFLIVLTKAASTTLTVSSAPLQAATASITATAAAAAQVTLTGLAAQVVVDVAQTVAATVRDTYGNVVTNYTGTLHFTNTDAQAPAIADLTLTAADLGVTSVAVRFATAGTQTLTVADTVTASVRGSASTLVVHGPAAQLVLTGLPPSTAAGTLLVAVVTVADTHANVVTDFVGTVHFSSSDASAQLPGDTTYVLADGGRRSFPVVLAKAATSTVTVSSAGLPPVTATVAVAHAAAALVTLENLPAQVAVDVPQTLAVTVRDAFGNVATDYTGTLHFTNTDPQAAALADVTFTTVDLGTRSVTVQFATAGVQTFSAADTAKPSISGSTSTLVIHGAAAALRLAGLPPTAVAGALLTATVSAVDAHGNLVTNFADTVHFASSDAGAQLPADYVFAAGDGGAHAFSLALITAATSSVTASSAGLLPASADVTVRNASAAQVTLTGLPAQVAVDAPQTIIATVRDGFGNTAVDYAGTVRFSNTDPQAVAIADQTFTAANAGVRTVVAQFATAGVQTITAKDLATPSIAGAVSTFVTAGAATRLVLGGLPASTVAGNLLTALVTAVDAHGNTATAFTGTVHFSSSDATAQLPADTTFVAGDAGSRSFAVVLKTSGQPSISVSQVAGTATGATVTVGVSNAPASRIAITPHSAQVTVDAPAAFTLVVRDAFGNPALDYVGTVHFVTTDAAATPPANLTFTRALFATADVSMQFATAGDQSLIATDTVNAAITGSTSVQVTSGAAVAYALSPLPGSAAAGEPLTLTITAVDAHGNVVPNYAGSVSVASTDATDRLPPPGGFVNGARSVSVAFVTAGPHHATVLEVAGTIRADTTTVNIIAGNAAALVVSGGTTTAGAPTPVTVTAKDAFGNQATSYAGTVAITATDPQAVLPPPYTFSAADAGQHVLAITLKTAGISSVIATDAANGISGAAVYSATPAAAASCQLDIVGKAGSDVAFRVDILDAFANLATGYTGTVTFTSSDASATLPPPSALAQGTGNFAAVLPTAGDQTIRATDATVPLGCQATVSIVPAPFFSVTFSGTESWAGAPRNAVVQAQTPTGAAITNYAGTIVFSSSDGAASLPASVTLNGSEGGTATVNITFNTIGLQTFTATDGADATRTGSAFQVVHGLVYTNPAPAGRVQLVSNASSTASVVQLDLVSNASLTPVGVADPQNGRLLPSSARDGVFAAGMNLPLDATRVSADTQLLVQPPPATAIFSLGAVPQATGAALTGGVLYSGVSQKRFDATATCTAPCTNDHLRGDVQVRPFPGATSVYYSIRLRLTAGAAPGTVFDGQTLATNVKFHAAARDRSGSDVFSGAIDFALGKLEVK